MTPQENSEQKQHELEETTPVSELGAEPLVDPTVDVQLHADHVAIDQSTPQHPNPATEAQSIHRPLQGRLQDYHVEEVFLDDIYVEEGQDEEGVVASLADSIDGSDLLQHITVIENNIRNHPAKYRLLFGRKRFAAYLARKRTTIPARIWCFPEGDVDKDLWIARLRLEENLVRKHYSLTEMCELLGQYKEIYERTHPDAMQGRAPKRPKDSGTESLQSESYLTYIARLLHKSKSTVWKYVYINTNLIQALPQEYALLKQYNHPILRKVEDLLKLAQSEDLEALARLLCGLGMTPDAKRSKPSTLRDAQKHLEQDRAEEAREKDQMQVQEKGDSGEELPPQPPETPLPSSTLMVPATSSALEISATQPHDTSTTPPPESGSVPRQHSAIPAPVEPSPDEEFDTIDHVLLALDANINTYLRANNLFNLFYIKIGKTSNAIRILVKERA